MRSAVFLDRDGTVIREVGYLERLDQIDVLPGAGAALRELGNAGYLRILVTNQSGIARGYFDASFVRRTHDALLAALRRDGAGFEAAYFCPHLPELTGPCQCRKPAVGMIEEACRDFAVDLTRSWVVGDKQADLELARNAGCRAALVRTGYGRETEAGLPAGGWRPALIADTLLGAVEEMLGR